MHSAEGGATAYEGAICKGDMMDLYSSCRGTKALAQHCWLRCLSPYFGNLAGFVQLVAVAEQESARTAFESSVPGTSGGVCMDVSGLWRVHHLRCRLCRAMIFGGPAG